MKAKLTLLTLAAVILVLAGFSGCTKKDAGTTAMEKAQETNAPAEHPATDKPKDHPAH